MSDTGRLIVEITRNVERDHSPLQLVSADVLAYYRRCVVELEALKSNSGLDRLPVLLLDDALGNPKEHVFAEITQCDVDSTDHNSDVAKHISLLTVDPI